jgi:hypothetical protein
MKPTRLQQRQPKMNGEETRERCMPTDRISDKKPSVLPFSKRYFSKSDSTVGWLLKKFKF